MFHRGVRGGERGATLIFFAAIVTGLLAIAGLVVDGGFLYAERRQQQNAADAAAMAGTQALDRYQRSTSVPVTAVWDAVAASATQNGADLDEVECTLVDELAGPISAIDTLGQPILEAARCPRTGELGIDPGPRLDLATGVRVQTAATKPTNFMSVLGVSEFRAPGAATATLQAVLGLAPGASPFMVCGSSPSDLERAMEEEFEGQDFQPRDGDTGATPLIVRTESGTWVPNEDAFYNPTTGGPSFPIHGPQGVAQCGAQSDSFKGLVEEDADVTVPWVPGQTGTRAGPTRTVTAPYQTVVGGEVKTTCAVGQEDDCVMVLPICSHSNGGQGNGFEMRCVMFGSFYVTKTGDNSHNAYLLGEAAVVVDGIGGGKPNDIEARMIKLVE